MKALSDRRRPVWTLCLFAVFNLYYKSDPHRGRRLLALLQMEALRRGQGEKPTCACVHVNRHTLTASQGRSKGRRLLRYI